MRTISKTVQLQNPRKPTIIDAQLKPFLDTGFDVKTSWERGGDIFVILTKQTAN